MFLRNYQSLLKEDLEEKVSKKYSHRLYDYKLNTSISMGILNERLVDIFMEKEPGEIIQEIQSILIKNAVPIIPNRSARRQKDRYLKRKKPKVLKNRKRVI